MFPIASWFYQHHLDAPANMSAALHGEKEIVEPAGDPVRMLVAKGE